MKKLIVGLWLAVISLGASAQVDCRLNPESCMTPPIAKACPSGQKWSTAGSGVAHCVNAEPACASADKVSYDAMGNPSCVARCATSDYWDGSACRPCSATSTASGSCQEGNSGTAYRSVTTNSCAGTTSYGNWDYSQCSQTCKTETGTEAAACPAGYNGNMTRTASTNSCSGTTYGDWDTSGCSTQCGTTTSTEQGSCQADYQGSAYRNVTDNSCTGSRTYGTWDYSNCVYAPSAQQCPPRQWFCEEERWQSDDPRDIYYSYGYATFEGPSCEPVRQYVGNRSQADGGCPPEYYTQDIVTPDAS